MSIASNLTKLETDITNAYNAINTKGGTIPSNKNTENLSTAINSISGGGSSGDYEYDNWISYGLTTPSVSDYKYWLPVDTTPITAPLKYVANYRKADCFTGELGELATDETGTNMQKVQNSTAVGSIQPDDYNHYFTSPEGQNMQAGNSLIYKYTYSNQTAPGAEFSSSAYTTNLGYLKDLVQDGGTTYTCWTAYNNTIYACGSNNINQYDVSAGTAKTWARTSLDIITSSYRGLGLYRRSSSEMLIFRTNSSGTNLQALTFTSSGVLTTKKTLSSLTGMTSFSSIKINSNLYLILYKTASHNLTNTNHTKMYLYDYTNNTFTQVTLPFNTGYMYTRYLIPENAYIFKFTADSYNIYTLNSSGFAASTSPGYGNLVKSAFKYNTGAIVYKNGMTCRVCVPTNNFIMRDTDGNDHTYSFENGDKYSYNVLQTYQYTNYEITHEVKENVDSTNNVLIISNYLNQDRYSIQSYKFYPKSDKNIFLWMYRNGSPKFIYNKTEYIMQISDGTQWSTTDTENNIM